MEKTIAKSRIRLRAMEPEDLDFLYEVENDERIWNVGSNNVHYSRAFLLDYMTSCSGDIYADKQVRLMIENEVGETIGMVDLINFSPDHRRAEIGIVIKSEYRRQGYSHEVMAKIIDYGKNVVHLHQIYAIVPKDNEKSQKMLKRSGFQWCTTLKDWLFDGSEYHPAELFQIFL